MAGGLLNELATVDEDEGLCSIAPWRFDPIDQLSKDDLGSISSAQYRVNTKPTVLPLPVANDIPSLLCPSRRYDNID